MSQAQKAADQLIGKMRSEPPKKESLAVINNGTSLRTTIMADAWADAGIDPENPGELDHYYFQAEGVILIDLGDCDGGE